MSVAFSLVDCSKPREYTSVDKTDYCSLVESRILYLPEHSLYVESILQCLELGTCLLKENMFTFFSPHKKR